MSIRVRLITLILAGIALAGVTSCHRSGVEAANENQTTDLSSQKILSMDDQKFLVSADKTLIRQRNLAQAAVQKSKSGNVFEFARRVVADCSASLTELSRLMQAKHITEPSTVAEDLQLETSNRLQGLAGIDLDHKIISLMAAEQQQAVGIFSSAAETAGDPDVRKYASATLPSLQRDSDRAAALEKKLSTTMQK